MTYQPDPTREPQSSGRTDVQVVEEVTRLLAASEGRILKNTQALISDEIKEGFAVYAPIFDTIMEGRLRAVNADVREIREIVGRNDARFTAVHVEIQQTRDDVATLNARMTASEQAGAVLIGNNPTLRTLAMEWLDVQIGEKVTPRIEKVIQQNRRQFWIGITIICFLTFFLFRALGWLHWMGL